MKVQVGVEVSFVNCDGLFSTFHHIRYRDSCEDCAWP